MIKNRDIPDPHPRIQFFDTLTACCQSHRKTWLLEQLDKKEFFKRQNQMKQLKKWTPKNKARPSPDGVKERKERELGPDSSFLFSFLLILRLRVLSELFDYSKMVTPHSYDQVSLTLATVTNTCSSHKLKWSLPFHGSRNNNPSVVVQSSWMCRRSPFK